MTSIDPAHASSGVAGLAGAPQQSLAFTNPRADYLYQRNLPFVKPGQHNYNTQLSPEQEQQFRQWLPTSGVQGFDPNHPINDYDMRGFWLAQQQGDPRATGAISPDDKHLHLPDVWKTPYHHSFSSDSQWANPDHSPKWQGSQLVAPDGTILYVDLARKVRFPPNG